MNITKSTYLAEMDVQLQTVRTAIKGSPFVKKAGKLLLPNPSNVLESDLTTAALARHLAAYDKFLHEAEFDDYTQLTERVMTGKLAFDKASMDLPDKLQYLLKSADGDGLSMRGLLENTAQNILAAKWHIVVCDYQGLTSLDITQASAADVEKANPRATLKEYPRESVYHASYSVRNGVKQLSLLVLRELGVSVNPETLVSTEIESFLLLSIDVNGQYNQRKITQNQEGQKEDSGNIPVSINNKPVTFIPVFIASDEELTAGNLPQQLGFLSPIADICLARYSVSGKFKSALARFVPTLFLNGFTEDTWAATCKMNGSKTIQLNGINALATDDSGNVAAPTVSMVSATGHLDDFFKYNTESLERLRSLGASVPNDSSATTATKAKIDAAQQNAVLIPIADNLERMAATLFCYAAMFEGLVEIDKVESFSEQLVVTLTRDFTSIKGTPEELTALVNLYVSGLRTKEQIIKMTYELGWDVEELEDIIKQIDLSTEM